MSEQVFDVLVLRPGTEVVVGKDIPGTITTVVLTGSGVKYEVAWWDGRARKSEWLIAEEVTARGPAEMKRIGFLEN